MTFTDSEIRKHFPDAGRLTIALIRHLTQPVLGEEAQDILAEPMHKAEHLRKLGEVLVEVEQAKQLIAERDAKLDLERRTKRERRDKLNKLRTMGNIQQLLDAEKAARSKHKRKKQPSLERRAELRMFASYVTQEREKRHDADRRRMQIAWQQLQDQELTQERDRQRQHFEQLRERGQRIPTYAERRDQEEEKRDLLRMYYVALIAEEDLMRQKRERERSGMELER